MFTVKSIGNLSKEASQKAIMLPLKNSDINFTNKLIDALIEETLGYPYFLQFYPYYLIQNVPKKKIGVKEFKEMYPLLLKDLDESFFSGRFNKASDSTEKGLIFRVGRGKYRFTLPLFEEFLLRKR